jgi:hypothetical protein
VTVVAAVIAWHCFHLLFAASEGDWRGENLFDRSQAVHESLTVHGPFRMFKFLLFFCFVYSLLLVVLASSNVQFRGLGLRHLPIVNDTKEVIGMVTRKDLARYRVWRHQGRMGVEELLISKEIWHFYSITWRFAKTVNFYVVITRNLFYCLL